MCDFIKNFFIKFCKFLRYIYTGELDLTKQSVEDIFGLLTASDELLLEELSKHVQDYLIEKHTDWIQKNFVPVLHAVFKLASCKKLQDHCLESICENPKPFIASENFSSLDKEILFGLLEKDDLQIEEIDAWNCLIKWGIEQTPGLGSENNDRAKWTQENFEALKKTLNQFIPLIRFLEISGADVYDKVRPYKDVIPKHIYDDIEKFYYKQTSPETIILSPRSGRVQIESKIIQLVMILMRFCLMIFDSI